MFSVSGNSTNLTIFINNSSTFWNVSLSAPSGEKLHPGIYSKAERAPFRTGRSPGIDISGDGAGCNEVWGNFTINQIATDSTGKVNLLDATFLQRCESETAPALKGSIKLNALPLTFSFVSDAGDYIGSGESKSYTNSSSIFSLTGSDTSFTYSVSGLRDNWNASISAPIGQKLKVGTYSTARFNDETHAGLDFSGNGRGCNSSTGQLKISAIDVDSKNKITGFTATFTQHCEGLAPAINGKINYYD